MTKPSVDSGNRFIFWACQTPTVTAVTPKNGTSSTAITIRGTGFSDKTCHNKVTFGVHNCIVQSSSTTEITCKLDTSTKPRVGDKMTVALNVRNRGDAVIQGGVFTLHPTIDSVSPSSGSKAGGSPLTISGNGFAETLVGNVINVGSGCLVTSATFSEVKCTTKDPGAGVSEAEQQVSATVYNMPSTCSTPPSCVFSFKTSKTPEVTEFLPTDVSGASQIRIYGSRFPTDKSKVSVKMGPVVCTVTTSSNTEIKCTLPGLVAGPHKVVVNVDGFGHAQFTGSSTINSTPLLLTLSPSLIGKNGGVELTLDGNGFDDTPDKTTVAIAGKNCPVTSVSVGRLKCIAPAHTCRTSVCDATVVVTVNGNRHPTSNVAFSDAETPSVTSVSPTSGKGGDSLIVNGDFKSSSSGDFTVTIGGTPCTVTAFITGKITCKLSAHTAGIYPVKVVVANKGFATSNAQFTYKLGLDSISPPVSGFGGGRVITLQGNGFSTASKVTVCGNTCPLLDTASITEAKLTCAVPPNTQDVPGSGSNRACTVGVTLSGQVSKLGNAFTYKDSLTSVVTSVLPDRGGTGGGVVLKIKGSGFDATASNNKVTIDGVTCTVTAASGSELTCTTGSHNKTIKTTVRVEVGNTGIALGDKQFWYVDVWSSKYSWGNKDPPKKG